MAADTQHENVGTRAEYFVLGAGHHDGAHFWVLEADAVDGIVQFNIDTQVVTVELELVTRTQAGVFININRQGGDSTVKFQFPVLVLRRISLIFDAGCSIHGLISLS